MDPNELTDEIEERARESKAPDDHLEAGSANLSLDDLEPVAGGVRGRKNTSREGILGQMRNEKMIRLDALTRS